MGRSIDTNKFSRAVPHPFGIANWVTALRASAAVSLFGLGVAMTAAGFAIGPVWRWGVVVVATAALALDGVDGFLARRLGQASAFGARFDMETDALLMLALALLVWRVGLAGAWVLLSGALRYIFIIGGWLWPVLAMPLPPRRRRQRICVAQMGALIAALAPPVTGLWAPGICLAGLILLSYSFGSDMAWLVRRRRAESEAVVEQG
jgi:phosphatidylglycerophosphate synthase